MPVGRFHGLRYLLIAVGKKKRLGGKASEQDAVDAQKVGRFWRMDSISLLTMPAAIFAPTSEAFLIWDFQAATSWQMSKNILLISSMSSWKAPYKGGRGALQAELILLTKARVDSTYVRAARPQVPTMFATSASSKALPFMSLGPR
jgi:hypothetical protein